VPSGCGARRARRRCSAGSLALVFGVAAWLTPSARRPGFVSGDHPVPPVVRPRRAGRGAPACENSAAAPGDRPAGDPVRPAGKVLDQFPAAGSREQTRPAGAPRRQRRPGTDHRPDLSGSSVSRAQLALRPRRHDARARPRARRTRARAPAGSWPSTRGRERRLRGAGGSRCWVSARQPAARLRHGPISPGRSAATAIRSLEGLGFPVGRHRRRGRGPAPAPSSGAAAAGRLPHHRHQPHHPDAGPLSGPARTHARSAHEDRDRPVHPVRRLRAAWPDALALLESSGADVVHVDV